jgi:hypothetical protein
MTFWTATYPEIMFMASLRYSSLDLKQFLEILNSQIAHVDDIEELIKLDILAQELVGKLANNLMVTLFLNSVAPMLRKMTDVLYRNLSRESRLHFLQAKKQGVCRLMNNTLDLRISTENFRQEMEKCRQEIRTSIAEDMFDLQLLSPVNF